MYNLGHSENGTEVLPYKDLDLYDSDVVGEETHIYIPLDNLDWAVHGNHLYYASIRAENFVGLTSTVTSSPYRHIVQLPSKGVVLDVLSKDVANRTDTSTQFGVSLIEFVIQVIVIFTNSITIAFITTREG